MHVYYEAKYKSHKDALQTNYEYWRKFYQLQDFEYILKLGGSNFNFVLEALDMKPTEGADMRKLFFGLLGPVNPRLKEHVQRGADGQGENDKRDFGLSPEQTGKMIKALFYIANHNKTFNFGFGSINDTKSALTELTEVQEQRGRSIYESSIIGIIDPKYFRERLGFNEKQGLNDPREIKINLPHEKREFFIEVLKAYNYPYKYEDGAKRNDEGELILDASGEIKYSYDELVYDSTNQSYPKHQGIERDIGNYFLKLHDGEVALHENNLEREGSINHSTNSDSSLEFFVKEQWMDSSENGTKRENHIVTNRDEPINFVIQNSALEKISVISEYYSNTKDENGGYKDGSGYFVKDNAHFTVTFGTNGVVSMNPNPYPYHTNHDFNFLKYVEYYANRRGRLQDVLNSTCTIGESAYSEPKPFIINGSGEIKNHKTKELDKYNTNPLGMTSSEIQEFLYYVKSVESLDSTYKRITVNTDEVYLFKSSVNGGDIESSAQTITVNGEDYKYEGSDIPFDTNKAPIELIQTIEEYHFNDTIIKKNFFDVVEQKV